MSWQDGTVVVANFLLLAGLIIYGFILLAEYHSTGRWSKNLTSLLAGLGMLTLAFSLLITPRNAAVIWRIAQTEAWQVFQWASTALLLAAIAAFGIITYWKPMRLFYQRKLEKDLRGGLPRVP